jgi:hypothetical protein
LGAKKRLILDLKVRYKVLKISLFCLVWEVFLDVETHPPCGVKVSTMNPNRMLMTREPFIIDAILNKSGSVHIITSESVIVYMGSHIMIERHLNDGGLGVIIPPLDK